MRTVELFAGIGGFRLAADCLGFETVWANDFCPRACKVYRHRFGEDSIRLGNIVERVDEVPPHDLLTAGFPCQPFSSAGKKQGVKDPRGTLFNTVVNVLRRNRPSYFILENVKRLLSMERGAHFATILASLAELNYWIEWRLLNSADFGLAQNRKRVFIIGSRIDAEQGNGDSVVRMASKEDLSSGAARAGTGRSPQSWPAIATHGNKFPNWGVAARGRFYGSELASFSAGEPRINLRTILQDSVPSEFDFTESTVERLKNSNLVRRFVDGVEILSNQGGGARMGYTVFGINGLAPALTSTASRHYERYRIGNRYRRLTNVEYARLQGFADDHCVAATLYDQYALFGNAVPPPMAAWVMAQTISPGLPIRHIQWKRYQHRLFVDA